jgi:hypothetical protein
MGAVVLDSPIDNTYLPEISKYAQVSNLVQVCFIIDTYI